jgi:hypothetical protein
MHEDIEKIYKGDLDSLFESVKSFVKGYKTAYNSNDKPDRKYISKLDDIMNNKNYGDIANIMVSVCRCTDEPVDISIDKAALLSEYDDINNKRNIENSRKYSYYG